MPTKPRSPGSRIADDVEVVELINHGGQVWVYKVLEPGGVKVAKQLDADPASAHYPVLLERFRQSTRLGVTHANLVVPERCLQDGPDEFLIEPYVQGSELTALAHSLGGVFPIDRALRVGRHVGRALTALHARGIIHRDVKPSNVMVRPSGEAVLIDVGIAHRPGADLTQPGISMGTTGWMPPEQAEGESKPGPECDLYNLGLLLWWMATGLDPQFGPLHPEESNPHLPGHLDRLVAG